MYSSSCLRCGSRCRRSIDGQNFGCVVQCCESLVGSTLDHERETEWNEIGWSGIGWDGIGWNGIG